jgi:NTE family protein
LGCGGPVGFAWTLAVLAELERAWSWDARSAELIVGTSAGAELACMLGGGVPVETLNAALAGQSAPDWLTEHLAVDPGLLPGLPAARLTAPRLAGRALRGEVSALTGMAGLMPAGRRDPLWLRAMADRMAVVDGWVEHPATWLVATDLATGQRVAFGAPDAPRVSLADAVAASWGLPLWIQPMVHEGSRYVDGGLVSPASADFAAGQGLDEVVVLAPMASTDPGKPVGVLARGERIVRRQMTRVLDGEVAVLEAAGVRVHRFEPNGHDLAVMGPNFMDVRRQPATLLSAAASAREQLRRDGLLSAPTEAD